MPTKWEMSPAVHNITFCGLTGAIFVLLTSAVILYIEGFVTTSWSVTGNGSSAVFEGLWQTCVYHEPSQGGVLLRTSQVLVSVGFFGVVVSFILSAIYMTMNRASKNITIALLAFVCFVSVVFTIIGATVFGVVHREPTSQLSWSFGVTIASAALTFLAGVLTIFQIRRSNVRIC